MTDGTEVGLTETHLLDRHALERIQDVIGEIVRKASKRGGACVYRGEPQCYRVVSSGLYRKCPHTENEAFDIFRVEQEIVESARQYTTLTDGDEILTEIQHFGGTTNLIDFTEDYSIALFFACVEGDGTDGRVVLQWPESNTLVRPKQTANRIVSQRSVFVRPRRGFILPDVQEEIVIVPADLKASILTFLGHFHGISKSTVYNDIHGFIRHQNPSQSSYAQEFKDPLARTQEGSLDYAMGLLDERGFSIRLNRMGHAYHQKGMVYEESNWSSFWISTIGVSELPTHMHFVELDAAETVSFFTEIIDRAIGVPRMEEAHFIRGGAHLYRGKTDLAILDFDEVLSRYKKHERTYLQQDTYGARMAEAYGGRGNAYRYQGDSQRGMADLEEALRLHPGLPSALIDRGNAHRESGLVEEAIRDFEQAITHAGAGTYNRLTMRGDAHFYRAIARCIEENWRGAMEDLELARRDKILVASSFQNVCGGIGTFEAGHGVRIPSILATMLYVA